ncbi:S41 family peptidase [Tenacibaculum haliotis]|uniref:S41 family peptidase n=1 Tax=Tenacibaculum haliotis TaxID=1888914 RepID=UPI0028A20A5F|nr:S41 family peptidase [Tenacibaculum haliotis]
MVLKLISEKLLASYINLDLAKEMSAMIISNSKKYKSISNQKEFSTVITKDLQKVSKDLHLKVNFEPKRITQSKRIMPANIKLKRDKMMAMKMAEINFGFTETKVLNGNIGYLNLRMFADMNYAKETATAAMSFLKNTNAIIIDLRNNGGGVPNMMQLLSSYFTGKKPVLLSNFYERKTNNKTQLFTLESIDGKRRTNTPLYILTSKKTFSAAEAFTYTLKHLNKAIVVGETTRGGANRTKRVNLNNNFTISIPYIEATHPVTKTNWEGKGVKPTIKSTKKDAFIIAYIDALDKTIKRNKNNILNKVGYTYLQEKNVDLAIKVFQKSTKLFPKDANSWDSLGEAYFYKKDKENALLAYKKAFELDASSVSAKKMIQKLESIK